MSDEREHCVAAAAGWAACTYTRATKLVEAKVSSLADLIQRERSAARAEALNQLAVLEDNRASDVEGLNRLAANLRAERDAAHAALDAVRLEVASLRIDLREVLVVAGELALVIADGPYPETWSGDMERDWVAKRDAVLARLSAEKEAAADYLHLPVAALKERTR